jgi:hypothetical protein
VTCKLATKKNLPSTATLFCYSNCHFFKFITTTVREREKSRICYFLHIRKPDRSEKKKLRSCNRYMVWSFSNSKIMWYNNCKKYSPQNPQNKNILSGITTSFYKFYLPINEGQKAFMPRTDSQRSPRYFDPPHPLIVRYLWSCVHVQERLSKANVIVRIPHRAGGPVFRDQ